MKAFLRTPAVRLLILCLCLTALIACDEEAEEGRHKADAQRQAELQAQLVAEQAQRRRAEEAVVAAEQASSTKLVAVVAGSCVVILIVGMAGIAMGSRALKRSGKEPPHG